MIFCWVLNLVHHIFPFCQCQNRFLYHNQAVWAVTRLVAKRSAVPKNFRQKSLFIYWTNWDGFTEPFTKIIQIIDPNAIYGEVENYSQIKYYCKWYKLRSCQPIERNFYRIVHVSLWFEFRVVAELLHFLPSHLQTRKNVLFGKKFKIYFSKGLNMLCDLKSTNR